MERAKAFIKSATATKSKKEMQKIVQNLELIIENHERNEQEDIKLYSSKHLKEK
jgi:hypothetical protein